MNDKTDIRWLILGAAAGLLAAGYGVRQASDGSDLPAGAVASVNEVLIGRDVYERAVQRFAPQDASPEEKAALLQRLIDDELLVQRGVELGMTESDTEVRSAIVNSLVASVTAEADAANPDDRELAQYLADNAERFSYTAKLEVEVWQTDIEPVAQAFVAALRSGERPETGDDIVPMPDLPAGLLPTEILRDYVGPAIAAAAAEMPDGSSAVFARRGRWLIVRVVGKERGYVDDLDGIRNRVLLDYRRNLADRMLDEYIDNLRQRADIRGVGF